MRYEVEQKFPVDDLATIAARLDMLGASVSKPKTEEDLYFAHPSRDFAETDEALRIRRKGDATFITYKGPKVDTTTKTRRELELPLPFRREDTRAMDGLARGARFSPSGHGAQVASQDRHPLGQPYGGRLFGQRGGPGGTSSNWNSSSRKTSSTWPDTLSPRWPNRSNCVAASVAAILSCCWSRPPSEQAPSSSTQ